MPAQTRLAEPQLPSDQQSNDRGNCWRTVADARQFKHQPEQLQGSFPERKRSVIQVPRSTQASCLAQAGPCCDAYSLTRRLRFARPILRRIT
jgi:hypothetical protein